MNDLYQRAKEYASTMSPSAAAEPYFEKEFIESKGNPRSSVIRLLNEQFSYFPPRPYITTDSEGGQIKFDPTKYMREAFNAAREEDFHDRFGKWKYNTFEDYLNSKKINQQK